MKMLFDGQLKPGRVEDGGTTWDGVDEILTKYVEEKFVKQYVEERLLLQFSTPPKISDTRRLLWRLWASPSPPQNSAPVNLGRISVPYTFIRRVVAMEEVAQVRSGLSRRAHPPPPLLSAATACVPRGCAWCVTRRAPANRPP